MDLSCVNEVKDLHHSENIEDIGHVSAHTMLLLVFAIKRSTVPVLNSSWEEIRLIATKSVLYIRLRVEMLTSEHNSVNDDNFINGHTHEVLDHFSRNDVLISSIWRTIKEFHGGWFSGKSQRGKRVHDKVDPEELNGLKRSLFQNDRADECSEHGNNVDCKLELKELANVVINTSSPHDSLDD
jgi:hypothetical protein